MRREVFQSPAVASSEDSHQTDESGSGVAVGSGAGAACSMDRRGFLRRAATGGAAILGMPLIVPGRVLGRDGGVAPSERITIGCLGTGRQAIHANIPGFLAERDARIVAVCDVDSWRSTRAQLAVDQGYARLEPGAQARGCAVHRDWRELMARPDIDAVMISTPDHWHVIMALAALRAGKDVACEKPLTRNIAEGRLLADTVKRTGRVFRTDSEFRSIRACHRVVQIVRNGRIGKLERIIVGTPTDTTLAPQPDMPVPEELDYAMWLGPAPEVPYTEKRVHPRHNDKGRPGWICNRDYADGMMANWGAHLNDIAMWANDTEHTGPVEVRATGKFPPRTNLWNIVLDFEAEFRFANGVRLVCRTDKPFMRFEGSEGWIQVTYPSQIEASAESLIGWTPGPNDLTLPFKTTEKRDFLDAVKSRKQPLFDAEAGHRNASLAHLSLASMELGRPLKWDPVRETVPDDAEANRYLQPKPLRGPWKL
jgi:predicted dehydrogenase